MLLLLTGMLSAGVLYSCSRSLPGTEVRFESRTDGEAQEPIPEDSFFVETASGEMETAFGETKAASGEMEMASEEAKTASEETKMVSGGAEAASEIGASDGAENSAEREIWVHICGQVAAPGVYSLREGSRVFQALEAAGGVLEQGDGSILNQAMILEDGMRIEVPDRTEAERLRTQGVPLDQVFVSASGGDSSGASGRSISKGTKVNLNQAEAEELMTLTGIGKARAEAIIQYRREAGPFRSIEDIMNVSGIKESAFEKIREDITV